MEQTTDKLSICLDFLMDYRQKLCHELLGDLMGLVDAESVKDIGFSFIRVGDSSSDRLAINIVVEVGNVFVHVDDESFLVLTYAERECRIKLIDPNLTQSFCEYLTWLPLGIRIKSEDTK